MVGVEKTSGRPFGQRDYPDLNSFRPTLVGPHYKFTLLIPVIERSINDNKETKVFADADLDKLIDLFCKDFGGQTSYREVKGPPAIKGHWLDDESGDVVIDWHVRIEIYTKKYDGAVEYFEELKARLLKYSKDVVHVEQKELIVERTDADFVRRRSLETIIMESEERFKYLKR